jgi:glyoxylate carboligase
MEMLSGAEMVVQSLVDQGVKQVFGYPGGAVLDIYDALHTLGVSTIFWCATSRRRCIWRTALPERPVK